MTESPCCQVGMNSPWGSIWDKAPPSERERERGTERERQRERQGERQRERQREGGRITCMPLISLREIWANITLHGWKKKHIVWHSTHYARQSVLRLWKYLRGMCPGQCECALFIGRCFLGNKDYVSKPGNACLRTGTTHNNKTEA